MHCVNTRKAFSPVRVLFCVNSFTYEYDKMFQIHKWIFLIFAICWLSKNTLYKTTVSITLLLELHAGISF